jgi:hypothetical protein
MLLMDGNDYLVALELWLGWQHRFVLLSWWVLLSCWMR